MAAASCQFDLTPAEIESWVEDGRPGMESALGAKPEDVREQYERQLKDLQEAYGEAMLEIRARKKRASLLGKDDIRLAHQAPICALRLDTTRS